MSRTFTGIALFVLLLFCPLRSMEVVLGSSSVWRKQVIESLGYKNIRTMRPDIDEKAIRDSDPEKLTLKIARAKAAALLQRVKKGDSWLIITADQVVFCDGHIREKPESAEECKKFLRSYKDHPAECVNGVVVTNVATGKQVEGNYTSKQFFKEIPERFMDELIAKGDVMHCCGGFVVEQMEPYLTKREGELEGVLGLPRALLERLLKEAQESS